MRHCVYRRHGKIRRWLVFNLKSLQASGFRENVFNDKVCKWETPLRQKLFRKSKEYKKELSVINIAIKYYEAYYKKHRPKHSKTVDDLSSKLNKSLGLVDKKGLSLNDPEPIGKWKKRKEIVQKKLAK